KESSPNSELIFYKKIKEIYTSENIFSVYATQPKLVAIQETPKIILPSGSEFGPVEKGQIIVLTEAEDISFLKNNNICQEI
ncbi:MAG: hypothetical protein QXS81_01650, partial [Candidatus Micrarchaeaceae archaeon]